MELEGIWVTDANVFIDLEDMGLEALFFQLANKIYTTSLVWAEIESSKEIWESFKESGVLTIKELTIEERTKASVLTSGNLSEADVSVLWYALEAKALLLTGEKKMRNVARGKGLEVHGTIWVLDQLLESNLISNSQACRALETLMEMNVRLPKEACNRRLKDWGRE